MRIDMWREQHRWKMEGKKKKKIDDNADEKVSM
jgi:hypothetical protein